MDPEGRPSNIPGGSSPPQFQSPMPSAASPLVARVLPGLAHVQHANSMGDTLVMQDSPSMSSDERSSMRGGTPVQPRVPIDDDSSVDDPYVGTKDSAFFKTTRSEAPWASPSAAAAASPKAKAPKPNPLDRADSWASHVSNSMEKVMDRARSSSKDVGRRLRAIRRTNSGEDQPFPSWNTTNMDQFMIIPERVKHKVLLVFLNPMSGGQLGRALIEKFRRFLNPIQVVDLSKDKPTKALELFRCVAEEDNLVVVVCGGDGSAGWIMDSIAQSYQGLHVPLGLLPLGTGNDLAQVLGWGAGHTLEDDLSKFLRRVHTSTTTLFDRWSVDYVRIRSPDDEKETKQKAKQYIESSPGG